MKSTMTTLGAFMTGFGGAFALFPTGQLAVHMQRQNVQTRIYNNFRAAGDRLRTAEERVTDEHQEAEKRGQ